MKPTAVRMAGPSPLRFDPAIEKVAYMSKNRWRYFRWTPRTALITFICESQKTTDGQYNMRAKLRAVKDADVTQPHAQKAAVAHEDAKNGTAADAAARCVKPGSTTTSKHETKAGAKALDTHKEGTKCTSCDSIKNTRDLDGKKETSRLTKSVQLTSLRPYYTNYTIPQRLINLYKKCTSCASGITNPPTASKESVREQWNPSAFRPLKEIDNGGRLGRGFKASWALARHEDTMFDMPDVDNEAEEFESDDELDGAPY
ncbi:hypothetical protein PMZ80_002315 [Knufia obscura]|uniref:Uncharacterized protein n=1 Tax=Knufia obscura TaxID=1635080 RepID=A0ABR0RWZ0_9EURO|nr:hypothetical protein PMZ80_002315 [Knufia obscura]